MYKFTNSKTGIVIPNINDLFSERVNDYTFPRIINSDEAIALLIELTKKSDDRCFEASKTCENYSKEFDEVLNHIKIARCIVNLSKQLNEQKMYIINSLQEINNTHEFNWVEVFLDN